MTESKVTLEGKKLTFGDAHFKIACGWAGRGRPTIQFNKFPGNVPQSVRRDIQALAVDYLMKRGIQCKREGEKIVETNVLNHTPASLHHTELVMRGLVEDLFSVIAVSQDLPANLPQSLAQLQSYVKNKVPQEELLPLRAMEQDGWSPTSLLQRVREIFYQELQKAPDSLEFDAKHLAVKLAMAVAAIHPEIDIGSIRDVYPNITVEAMEGAVRNTLAQALCKAPDAPLIRFMTGELKDAVVRELEPNDIAR